MKRALLTAALLSVLLCAGCGGSPAVGTAAGTGSATSTEASDISDIIDDEDEDNGEDRIILDDIEDEDVEDEVSDTVADNAAGSERNELVSYLQACGQLVYGDKNFQLYYYGDTTDDDGNLVSAFGYRCFHGNLVRITGLSMHLGTVINADGVTMYISPKNTLTDGYICISSVHGDDAYYDKPEEKWWTDNDYIYMRYLNDFAVSDPEKYAESKEKKDGFCTPEEFLEKFGSYGNEESGYYENVIPICLDELSIQQARITEDNKLVFDEPSEENTCKVSINYSVNVIRVPFDTNKTEDSL